MAYTIIRKKDKEKISDMVEDMLHIGGRLMTMVEEMEESDGFGERMRYRDGMGMRDGGHYVDRWDGYDPYMERRRRRY